MKIVTQQSGNQRSSGFTIVELLIVVVVIAILAAITTVAYNGITRRAAESVTQNALSTAQRKILSYGIDNGDAYPATLSAVGILNENGLTYQYTVNNISTPKGYCLTATTNKVSSYFCKDYVYTDGSGTHTANTANPTTGTAPGQSGTSGGTIGNYVSNPGVEVSTASLSAPNSTALLRDSTRAHSGTYSVRATMPIANAPTVGVGFFSISNVASSVLKPNTDYTVSAWVYVPTGTVPVRTSIQGTGKTNVGNGTSANSGSTRNQWHRIYDTFTTTASGNVSLLVLNMNNTTSAGTQFWVDDFMVTEGSTPPAFASGATPGWVWNGTAELSPSTGPAS